MKPEQINCVRDITTKLGWKPMTDSEVEVLIEQNISNITETIIDELIKAQDLLDKYRRFTSSDMCNVCYVEYDKKFKDES